MNNLAMIVTASLILIVVAALLRHNYVKQRYERQMAGLSWLQSMKRLLSHIQQHRGLSNGYLNGSMDLLAEIQSLQVQVSRDISDICQVGEWVEKSERWQNINQHWARLAGNFRHNEMENNLLQHNKLIQSVLFLIDDMALHHGLLSLKIQGDKPFYLLWRDLLSASEFIGQARAVGTGVAAKGECDSISRIKLNYLCKKVSENTDSVWSQLRTDQQCIDATNELLDCVKRQIILDQVSMPASQFFDLASKALNGLHDQYDQLIEEVRWQLKR
ncbi:MAG: hypothetical protein AseanaTS_17670 [Candidatus Pelagadaptatus aseana]|uniref:hypothetical protein n=1 Tax=Candidatus Pelagadaptatus aseana TaxID=3120508 RepID=UPI0039B24DE0